MNVRTEKVSYLASEMGGERFLKFVNEFTVNGERFLMVNFGEHVPQKSKNYLTAAPSPPPHPPMQWRPGILQ